MNLHQFFVLQKFEFEGMRYYYLKNSKHPTKQWTRQKRICYATVAGNSRCVSFILCNFSGYPRSRACTSQGFSSWRGFLPVASVQGCNSGIFLDPPRLPCKFRLCCSRRRMPWHLWGSRRRASSFVPQQSAGWLFRPVSWSCRLSRCPGMPDRSLSRSGHRK